MAVPRPDLSAFPDSPYATALKQGTAGASFCRRLEPEYVASRLSEHRALIRATCVLAASLACFGLLGKAVGGYLIQDQMLQAGAVVLASVALAVTACSRLFEHWYLPLARIVVPVRNAAAALFSARLAAHGQLEILMIMPLMVVGPFFFLGLSVRVALFSVAAALTSFAIAAAAFALPLASLVYCCVFLAMITGACLIAARHLDNRARRSFLEGRLIEELAEHDALTGTKNRRVLDEHLARLWQQASAERRTIAVLLIDVDHFKAYNDRYGHQAGDHALRRVAQALQALAGGPRDLLARYGGEEFVVVIGDAEAPRAAQLAERMRRAVAELAIEHRGGSCGRVTISVGVAALAPTPGRAPRGALQLADQALYDAKIRGRNRVEILEDEDYSLLVTGVFSKATAALLPDEEAAAPLRRAARA